MNRQLRVSSLPAAIPSATPSPHLLSARVVGHGSNTWAEFRADRFALMRATTSTTALSQRSCSSSLMESLLQFGVPPSGGPDLPAPGLRQAGRVKPGHRT